MKHFKLYNNIVGWVVFAVAAITYLLTIEPTGSFWDCGEFISSAYKLEVGHPPGAPFFILTARIFSLFASDPTQVAAMVNSMSALLSAFTILFLFWSITHIARRVMIADGKEMSIGQGIAILGAGLVGALAYTFSDTFWFSAVEGEVYAYSSCFTAVVFWCILKWEDVYDHPHAAKWLILIAYLMGLSIGVHLLNLLAIPAIVLVYYFRNYEVNWKNTLIALGMSVVILGAILYGMVPGCVKVASWFELFFVNTCGMSFNSGVVIYLAITIAALIWAIYETQVVKSSVRARIAFIVAIALLGIPFIGKGVIIGLLIIAGIATLLFVRKKWNYRALNTIILCATVMLIGYSSYTMIIVRSLANTPMDQNSPEDVFALQGYLNREQYGDRPLFYGAMYSAPEKLEQKGNQCIPIGKYSGTQWQQAVKTSENDPDRYQNAGKKQVGYEMDSRFKMLFPRMYSSQPHHVAEYQNWANIKGDRINVDRCGRMETMTMPTFGENLRFFFSYQCNFMYWRYFMWNFSGRQNDIQGHGEIDHGNWISGIPFIDNARLGDQSALPDVLKNNKGHNRYFMLPLLLGLLGIAWQLLSKKRGTQQFWVVMALFFMTGLAIVMYLNQTPLQPRERDYAYAGSFYAFSIWIGLGVMMLYSLAERFMPKTVAAVVVSLLSLGVPTLMACENWDDHDRSNRTMARDFGLNYLNTCDENAVIFSNGDNDTFPLWFNQEVEGNRTDMRVCNLSYLNTDWYIDQMRRGAYESKPLPINWEKKDYVSGHLDVSRVIDHPQVQSPLNINTAFDLLRNERFIEDGGIGNLVCSTLSIPVDKAKVIATGTVAEKDSAQIVDNMIVKVRGRSITKSQLMVLEMLRSNNWERPIYVASTVGDEYYPALQDYMVLEGLAYRIVPTRGARDRVNTEKMYDNMMNRFVYGDLGNPRVYLDEQHLRMARTMRFMFSHLTRALIREGQTDKARAAVEKSLEVLPVTTIPYDYAIADMVKNCYSLDMNELGDSLVRGVTAEMLNRLEWYASLPADLRTRVSNEMQPRQSVGIIQNMWLEIRNTSNPLADELESYIEKYYHFVQQ